MKLSIAQMSKYISFVLCVITLVMTIGCGRNAPPPASPGLSLEDEASIYAAVIRQLATVDDTFGGNLEPTKLFIIKNTDDKAGDPTGPSSFSTAISQTAQDKITDMLHDLSSIIVWIDKFEDAEFEEGKSPGLEKLPIQSVIDGGAIITLGNIHLQNDSSAQVAGSIYVASLAAGGATYILEKKEGSWEITGTTGRRWIS